MAAATTTTMGDKAELYVRFFMGGQTGAGIGDMPVFQGMRDYQQGAGFGSFFRGLLRYILPVAVRGAATFLGETSKAHDAGMSLGDAAKSALRPTAGVVLSGASDAIQRRMQGRGRKRKGKRKVYKGGSSKKRRGPPIHYNF